MQKEKEEGQEVTEIPEIFAAFAAARALIIGGDGVRYFSASILGGISLTDACGAKIGVQFCVDATGPVDIGGALGGSSGFLISGHSLYMCLTLWHFLHLKGMSS